MDHLISNYESLFNNIEIGIIYQHSSGKIIDANPASEKILGYSKEQLNEMSSNSSVWQAIKPDGSDFPANEHPSMLTIKTGKVIKDVVMGIIHPKTQNRIWISIDAVPEYEKGNKNPVKAFITFQDITEKQNVQNELIETQKKFQALFENGPIGIAYHKMIYDEKGKPVNYFFLDANENYQKLTGVDPRGKLVTEAFPGIEKDPADWIGTFARAGQHGETIRFQQYLQPVDRYYDAVGYQSSPDHFVAAFFEITEQKKKELELERLKNELEDKVVERTKQLKIEKENAETASMAKTAFLANMSHELRTPLNAVLGYAEILHSKEVDPIRKQYLNSISTSGKTLLSLINDVLDLSKIETGKFELQHNVVSIKNIFNELSTIFNKKIIDKGLHWQIEIDKNVPELLILDEMRLRQILLNLVGNAVKFTDNGNISLHCSIYAEEEAGKGESHLKIDVKDTGKGIKKNDLKRIFNAFEQARHQKVTEYGGTGLGLSISKNLAELMHGAIKVKSTLGKGSVFSLIIRNVERAKHTEQNNTQHLIDPESIDFKPAKILVVDDIDYNRDLIGTYLQSFNFEIAYANNGKQALVEIEQNLPDIILLDMKMPVMSGYELSIILKETNTYRNIPIIAITASSLSEDEIQIKKYCEGFLRKPVSRVQIVNELIKYLEHEILELNDQNFDEDISTFTIQDEKNKGKINEMLMNGDMDSIVAFAEKLEKKRKENKKTLTLLKEYATACNEFEIKKLLR